MPIRNLMEDVVSAIVDEVFASRTVDNADENIEIFKDDIITYVLNKIPPKYYTSERGILHNKLESQIRFQEKSDILMLAHEAIDIVRIRRGSELLTDIDSRKTKEPFFPHILGEVLESTTFSIISGVEVTLLYQDKLVEMIGQDWKNPYITNTATNGFFHFWPKLSDREREIKKRHFKVQCRHPKFKEKSMELEVGVVENRSSYKSYIVSTVLLESLIGADISF